MLSLLSQMQLINNQFMTWNTGELVTQGYNNVGDGWAGAYNSPTLFRHTHTHTQRASSTFFDSLLTDWLTDQPMDKKLIVAKVLMVSGTRRPYVSVCGCEMVRVAGAACLCLCHCLPKGPMLSKFWGSRLGFEPRGWDLNLKAGIWASRLGFEPRGWDLNHEAVIWAMMLGFEPLGWDLSFMAEIWALRLEFEPQGWHLSLKAWIWASRLGCEPLGWFEPQGWDLSLEARIWALRLQFGPRD